MMYYALKFGFCVSLAGRRGVVELRSLVIQLTILVGVESNSERNGLVMGSSGEFWRLGIGGGVDIVGRGDIDGRERWMRSSLIRVGSFKGVWGLSTV